MKKVITTIFVLIFASLTNAQITITLNDVENQVYVGQNIVEYVDTLMRQVDIGTPGSIANEWDFSFLNADEAAMTFDETVVDPSETEFADNFPNADYAIYMNGDNEYGTGELWWYFGSEGNTAVSYGYGFNGTTDLGSGSVLAVEEPAEIGGIYPMTLGTEWSYEGTETTTFRVGVIPVIITMDIEVTYKIDAYGTLILPGNKRVEALRLYEDRVTVTHIPFSPDDVEEEILYAFLTRTGEEVSVSLVGTNQQDHGYVFVEGIMWNNGNVTGVEDDNSETVAEKFQLKQNYPNPFNPSTTIEYSVPENSFVELKVYDIIGNEITTLVSGEKNRGSYQVRFDARDLASGTYIYSLRTNNFAETKKMILMK